MVTTLNLRTNIPPNREVHLTVPGDVPLGPADIVVVIASQEKRPLHTLGDLLASEFCGMWSDRNDLEDSVEYAHRLRREAWSRPARRSCWTPMY
jgi:hypothetical protein